MSCTKSRDGHAPILTGDDRAPIGLLALRSTVGGVLMGLANLVPGISGGTMLLAAGIYPRFISAIGQVTTLRFTRQASVVLVCITAAAAVVVVTLAGPIKDLIIHHRWIMYSLFIGLTLGGVPVIWRLIDHRTTGVWIGTLAGFVGMGLLSFMQSGGGGSEDNSGFGFMLLAGAAGASAMILPGISGGYLLLAIGVYVPILTGIDSLKEAIKSGNTDLLISILVSLILPVGLGVILGVFLVSNLLKWLLEHQSRITLGVLLGLLLGAVIGLYPFVAGVRPQVNDTLKGQKIVLPQTNGKQQLIYQGTGDPVEPGDYPVAAFAPRKLQVSGALALILAGFAVTMAIDLIGRHKPTDVSGAT